MGTANTAQTLRKIQTLSLTARGMMTRMSRHQSPQGRRRRRPRRRLRRRPTEVGRRLKFGVWCCCSDAGVNNFELVERTVKVFWWQRLYVWRVHVHALLWVRYQTALLPGFELGSSLLRS